MHVLLIYLVLFSTILASAQDYKRFGISEEDDIPEGIPLGSTAPYFKGVDQHGDTISLTGLLEKERLVLVFYRGNWCPYCNNYLPHLQDSLELIKEQNATVVAISPESIENISKTSENIQSGFFIISDVDGHITEAYKGEFRVTAAYERKIQIGLMTNISKHNGQNEAYLPVPATYIINQEGKIIFRHFDINYKERAPISEVIDLLSNDEN